MKFLITIAVFLFFACNNKSELTANIMALKDSCDAIDFRLDTLKRGNEIRQNQLLHPSQAAGVEKLLEDSRAMTDTAKHQKFMKMEVEYLAVKDSLEAIKKHFLRQIDSLQLELQE